ncbi:hypothetical protein SAMN04489729_4230 [Amycolatopsis lurida]|nr:hypothetical protein SAMN04489729_4230 [Amycolatopsis lurida]
MVDRDGLRPQGAAYLRTVEPPQPVWVDLRQVFPIGAPRATLPGGLDLTGTVPGTLNRWGVTVTGHWVGWVAYPLGTPGEGATWHRQWILSDALRPRHGGQGRGAGDPATGA